MSSEQISLFDFQVWKFLLKYNKFFKLGARKFHFAKYKKHFKKFFSFISFFKPGKLLPEI